MGSLHWVWLSLAAAVAAAGIFPATGQEAPPDTLDDALAALRAGDPAEASRIATEWLERDKEPNRNALWIRARAQEELEDYPLAVQNYRLLSQLATGEPQVLLRLGGASFKNGDMLASISAFDAAADLDRQLDPQLWQRGIAHYYAGRFRDGARQFDVHRTVNPQDVENSVWYFLCVAAISGFESAAERLIPIQRDGRVPMMEIYALFQGAGTVEHVLESAARASSGPRGDRPMFYAHLYLGLYYEALGDDRRSAEHIAKAVELKDGGNYMWHVARVHQTLRTRGD